MPIPFSLLPEHIRISIIQKQDVRDFLEFHVSSRHSYKMAKKIKTRFVVHKWDAERWENSDNCDFCLLIEKGRKFCILDEEVMKIPVRITFELILIEGRTSKRFCKQLTKFLKITNYSLYAIHFDNFEKFEGSPDQFNSLLEASKANKLGFNCGNEIPLEFLRVPAMKQIKEFDASCFSVLFDDARLLAVKASSIELYNTDITSSGLNSFLKEWLRGEKDISSVSIEFEREIEIEKAFLEIPYRTQPNPNSTVFMVSIVEREKDQKKIAVNFKYYEAFNTRCTLVTITAQ